MESETCIKWRDRLKMKIYLDNCCYNRPFDDQMQERVHLESEAILTILQRGQSGIYSIIGATF